LTAFAVSLQAKRAMSGPDEGLAASRMEGRLA